MHAMDLSQSVNYLVCGVHKTIFLSVPLPRLTEKNPSLRLKVSLRWFVEVADRKVHIDFLEKRQCGNSGYFIDGVIL